MVLTDDDDLAERLRLLRNLAFGRPRFYHEEPGHNFRLTGYQAAMGRVQLAKIDRILAEKRRVAATYTRAARGGAGDHDAGRGAVGAARLLDVRRPRRGRVRADAATSSPPRSPSAEIETRTFFCPMNLQPFLRDQPGFRDVPCPVAEELWRRGLYLPSSPSLTDEEVAHIAAQLVELAAVRS